MSTDVTAAVLEHLRASLPVDVTVYDGQVLANPPQRYVVVYGDIGSRVSTSLDGMSRDQAYSVQCNCVVIAPYIAGDCRFLASKVRDLLTDWQPNTDDVVPGQFEHTVNRRPVADESVPDRHVWESVQQFSLLTDRAAI